MTMRPSDYRDVVHPLRMQTRVFIAAGEPPCLRLRDDVARPKGRDYWTMRLGDLEAVQPPRRWVLVVILCPGDTTTEVVAWLNEHGDDAERVLFVLHPETDPVRALAAWYDAGHPDPVVCEADRFTACAATIGRFVNDWIYRDGKGSGWVL